MIYPTADTGERMKNHGHRKLNNINCRVALSERKKNIVKEVLRILQKPEKKKNNIVSLFTEFSFQLFKFIKC